VELSDIKKIMEMLEKSGLKKMVIKQDDFELHLEKESSIVKEDAQVATQQVVVPTIAEPILKELELSKPSLTNSNFIESPMVGTFYISPAPDQPPFVKVGDKVNENTVVCIIEAMKVMNEVKAGINGTVVEVLVDTSQPVEFGTPLFRIA
jgi:acetyl-CoA carboxylase biotin carboxyl carrier protein